MKKNIVVISTSPREGGNSDVLADEFIRGAQEGNHIVEKITLYDKTIRFCMGCLACQHIKTGHCVLQDDADVIINKMKNADVIVFATPIYFYEMNGQMKTLLDRTNPLFCVAYSFREVYLLTSAADMDTSAMDGAIKGIRGWLACFAEAKLKGIIYGTGLADKNAIYTHAKHRNDAYVMGKSA